MTTPDPVTEGAKYRAHLISLVGADDPADVQAQTPSILRALAAEAGSSLRVRPEPSEWSVLECVAHIADAEVVYAARYRWILAHDAPPLIGYDQDLWVDRLRRNEDDPAELLRVFEAVRASNLTLWRTTPVEDRERYGVHAERGNETYGDSFTMIAGHDRFHIDQARRALARLR